MQKEKFSEVYTWLSNRFISTLLFSNFLVIIGYSFRDDDITMNIKQALENNSQLCVITVSPNSHDIKRKFFEMDDVSVSSRIISIGMGIENVLNNENLYRFIKILESTVDKENRLWKIQYQNSAPMGEWYYVISGFRRISHDERIMYIRTKLSTYFPESEVNSIVTAGEKSNIVRWPDQ